MVYKFVVRHGDGFISYITNHEETRVVMVYVTIQVYIQAVYDMSIICSTRSRYPKR